MENRDYDRVYDKLVALWNEEVAQGTDPENLATFLQKWAVSCLNEMHFQRKSFGYRCRYSDCVEQNPIAGDDEHISCRRCRSYMGLDDV